MSFMRKGVSGMKQMSTYSVRISRCADIRKALSATAGIYRKAVDFFIGVCMEEWDTVSSGKGQTGKVNAVEALTIRTSKRKTVPYDFGKDFISSLPTSGGPPSRRPSGKFLPTGQI